MTRTAKKSSSAVAPGPAKKASKPASVRNMKKEIEKIRVIEESKTSTSAGSQNLS